MITAPSWLTPELITVFKAEQPEKANLPISVKSVAFEKSTGLYRIDNEFHQNVRLEGISERYSMVQKALRRNGIHASIDVDASISIVADEEKYILRKEGKEFHVQTIKDLLFVLTDLK